MISGVSGWNWSHSGTGRKVGRAGLVRVVIDVFDHQAVALAW